MKKMNVRLLTQLAMLIAMQFVLSRFCSINADSIRIGFGLVPMVVCGVLYGPVWSTLAYVVADVLGGFIIYGGPNPMVTVSYAIMGWGYGFFLNQPNAKVFPHALCAALVSLFCTMVVTTWALSMVYTTSFWAQFITRIPQGIFSFAAEMVLIPILMQLSRSLKKHGIVQAA